MRVVIIDDDAASVKELRSHLAAYPDVEVVGTASTGVEGLRVVVGKQPELLFLDIQLPDISGIDFLERMDCATHGHCRVVMYSAYDKYMLPAFRNKAFDFIVKPVDDEELATVMHRVYADRKYAPEQRPSQSVTGDGKYLLYTNTADFKLVNISDICVFQYNRTLRSWEVILSGVSEPVRMKRNVNSSMLLEISPDFIQIHQRFIINMNYLVEVADNTCRFFPPFDGVEHVKVGRFYRQRLISKFSSL